MNDAAKGGEVATSRLTLLEDRWALIESLRIELERLEGAPGRPREKLGGKIDGQF